MSKTTFKGPIRTQGAIQHVSYAAGTGEETVTTIVSATGVLTAAPVTTEPLAYALATGITAHASTAQSTATALTEEFNNVTTVASDGHGVKLPTAIAGTSIKVKNSGAASLAVWPFSGDSINAMAVNLSVNIPVGGLVTFNAISATVWETQEVLVSHAPTTQKGEFVFKAVDNTGDTVTTLSNAAMGQASVISIPDPGGATGTVMLLEGAQTIVGVQTFTNGAVFNGGLVGDVNGVAMAVEKGSGWAGAAAYSSEVTKQGKKITTHVFLDIQGLVVSATENDIIGDSSAANSHGGQFQSSEGGQYISGTITCLEAPTTGSNDIDFNVAVESNGAENDAVGSLTSNVVLVAGGGAWTLGMSKALTGLPNATSDYLYLSNGTASGNGTYAAGQFLIELIGYEA